MLSSHRLLITSQLAVVSLHYISSTVMIVVTHSLWLLWSFGILLRCVFCVSAECKCASLDLAFIVDSSESIGSSNFALAKDFIITVIDRLTKDQQVKVMSPWIYLCFRQWLCYISYNIFLPRPLQPTWYLWFVFIHNDGKTTFWKLLGNVSVRKDLKIESVNKRYCLGFWNLLLCLSSDSPLPVWI